ncbi:MAG: hypothetical protein AAF491_04870 [Verrucomicrobiota bacterium]
MKLDTIFQWSDESPRDCPYQMALDEALFRFSQSSGTAVLRFYSWESEALTFGYSESYPKDAESKAVRRFTGGGRVEHGEDLTFLLTLPAGSPPALLNASQRYQWIHESLRNALAEADFPLDSEPTRKFLATGPCFETPVPFDLLASGSGKKIVGGAQRRSRGSVIHQGSLRIPAPLRQESARWRNLFAQQLTGRLVPFPSEDIESLEEKARELVEERYANDAWNHRR